MLAITDPNLGLNYDWTLGESGWGTGMNANLKRLGAVVSLSVKDRDLATPPASPVNGDRYLISAGAWEYHIPKIGWLCFVEDEAVLSAYKATGWSPGIAI